MDSNNTQLINKFSILIDKIISLVKSYDDLTSKISTLTSSRVNILDINQYQDKDDINFYISIFEDTVYFLRKSLSVRKKKLKRDIIKNIKYLNQNISHQLNIDNIDKQICIDHFITYVNQKNKNNYRWVKNDKCKELRDWLKNFNDIINYHEYIYEYLFNMITINLEFFTNQNNETDKQLKINKINFKDKNMQTDSEDKNIYSESEDKNMQTDSEDKNIQTDSED